MSAVNRGKGERRAIATAVSVAAVLLVIVAVFSLTAFIDQKLNESAEQQVVTFTEQAAGNVSDRAVMMEDAIGAFTVQSSDPQALLPALSALQERLGLAGAAFAGMDGTGVESDGSPFSVDQIEGPETALSQGDPSYSGTFTTQDGVRVRTVQRPLYIDGQQVGALYAQIPLSLFAMPEHLDMFDGRGYFILFQADTGEILVPPADKTKTVLPPEANLYEFLDEASRYEEPLSLASPESLNNALLSLQARQGSDLEGLFNIVYDRSSGLVTAPVDGKVSYVCVAPVSKGPWYVCSVVPVENVRAEAAVVTTTFQAVFGIVMVCLIVAGFMVFAAYRRRVRERNVAMMAQLYRALSDSVDLAVNLYHPEDRQVTPIVAKSADIIGYALDDFLKNERLASEMGLSEKGVDLFSRIRKGLVDEFEHGEFSFRSTRTGSARWVAYSVRPLVFEGKQQVLIVLRDSTPDKQIQLSMKDAMNAAEAANQAKSDFLSRMSHEIRTPMNVIIGMLQIARGNVDDPEKMRVNLAKIGTASDHLLGLINDVLDLSKIENGKMTLASDPFRLADLLDHVEEVIRPQCEQRSQELAVRGPACADAVYVGDTVRLKQLLINLLSNSVKYTPEGGHVKLETNAAAAPVMGYRQVVFVVSDDGIGMSEEFVERMFEPFVMEGRSHEQGTGLGMSIVKNVVTMMGGSIEVDSAIGKGTTFTVTLSLRIAFEAELKSFEDDARDRGSSGPSTPRSDAPDEEGSLSLATLSAPRAIERSELEGLRVLIAEDNDLNAEIACELLAAEGLSIERARDGEEACALFEASDVGHYDVVLMDVQMPKMNGYDATRCIRALDREDARTVAIVAMSANAFSEDVNASLASGMDAHLSKPIEVRRVLSTIVEYTRKRR